MLACNRAKRPMALSPRIHRSGMTSMHARDILHLLMVPLFQSMSESHSMDLGSASQCAGINHIFLPCDDATGDAAPPSTFFEGFRLAPVQICAQLCLGSRWSEAGALYRQLGQNPGHSTEDTASESGNRLLMRLRVAGQSIVEVVMNLPSRLRLRNARSAAWRGSWGSCCPARVLPISDKSSQHLHLY